MKDRITTILTCFTLLFSSIIMAQVKSPKGALKDKHGNQMRGTPMVLGKGLPGSVEFARNIENWKYIGNNGFNTIRLCWVDPYYYDRGRDNWKPEEVLPHLDKVVENATKTGMNLIINLHNVGGQQRYDTTYKFDQEKEFWKLVAPRYKDNDLVYYEPANEPTFRANDYIKPEWRKSYIELYEIIRSLAPERQVLMFSFNNCSEGMLKVIENYKNDLDWQHTTIAYHMYGSPTSEYVKKMMENYTVICTEWWYHHKSKLPGNSFVKQVDGFKENSQTLEKIGSGWTDWRDWGDVTLNELLDTLIIDAKSKGYWWAKPVKTIKASGISISDKEIELAPGAFKQLYAYPLPALAGNQKVSWSSNDKNSVTVDKNGKVTATGNAGTAAITARTRDGGFTGTCTVRIKGN